MKHTKILKKLKPLLTHENKYVFGLCLTYKKNYKRDLLENHTNSYVLQVMSGLNLVVKYKGKDYTIDKVIENNYLLDICENAEQPEDYLQVYLKRHPLTVQ